MEISFSDILQAGVGVIALLILYQFIQNTSKDNERKDKASELERQRQQSNDERFMLLFATLTNKQVENTAQVMKSGVDSEGRLSAQVTTAETNIKGHVAAGADANTVAFEKVYRLLESAAKIALSRPPDPQAAEKYDKAIAVLTLQVEAVEADVAMVQAKAIAADAGTAATDGSELPLASGE